MTDFLVVVCVGMVIMCLVSKESIRRSLAEVQGEGVALEKEEQATAHERRQNEAVLAVTEGRERELLHDCKQLANQLGELQAQIEEVEARSTRDTTPEDETDNDGVENHS